jgi:hypothetical protein
VARRFVGTKKNTSGSCITASLSVASFACGQRLETMRSVLESRNYFGERMSAWVLTSRLCFFHNATQLALHGFERVMDDFFERFVSAVVHLPFIGHKLMARRHGHVYPTPVWVPFLMGVIGLLDGDIASVDVITKSLQSCCIIQNEIVDLVRFFQTPIR